MLFYEKNNKRGEYEFMAKKINELLDLVNKLSEENEQLKEKINEFKTDEKQLSISFMEYKLQLIEVLQQNYNDAYSQGHEVLAETVCNIAESMNVDVERFPTDGDV